MTEEITGHYVTVNRTRIYYDECGKGIPFFCIHSAGTCSLLYKYFLPIVAEGGFRGIALDLPGHGKSYPVDGDYIRVMHDYAEFVWRFIETIAGKERPVIIGCSIGGDMVLDLACHHSENLRAAVALEGAAYTQTFANVRELEDPHACPGWQHQMEWMSVHSLHPTHPKEKATELRWIHRYSPQESWASDLECWVDHDVREKLKDIKCPILVARGDADFYLPEKLVRETVAGIKQGLAESKTIPNAGHYPIYERPEDTFGIIKEFLVRRKLV